MLDILAAVMVIVPLISGIVRGFHRQMISLMSLAASAAIAFSASVYLVTPVYEKYFEPGLTDVCIKSLENLDPVAYVKDALAGAGVDITEEQLRERLASSGDVIQEAKAIAEEKGVTVERAEELAGYMADFYLQEAPEEIRSAVPKIMRGMDSIEINEAQLTDLVNAAASSSQEGGEYIEKNLVRPTAMILLRWAIFGVIFVIVQLILLLGFFIFGQQARHYAHGAADRLGGFGLGLLLAAGNLLVLCLIVSGVEKASLGLIDIVSLPSKVFLPIFKLFF